MLKVQLAFTWTLCCLIHSNLYYMHFVNPNILTFFHSYVKVLVWSVSTASSGTEAFSLEVYKIGINKNKVPSLKGFHHIDFKSSSYSFIFKRLHIWKAEWQGKEERRRDRSSIWWFTSKWMQRQGLGQAAARSPTISESPMCMVGVHVHKPSSTALSCTAAGSWIEIGVDSD